MNSSSKQIQSKACVNNLTNLISKSLLNKIGPNRDDWLNLMNQQKKDKENEYKTAANFRLPVNLRKDIKKIIFLDEDEEKFIEDLDIYLSEYEGAKIFHLHLSIDLFENLIQKLNESEYFFIFENKFQLVFKSCLLLVMKMMSEFRFDMDEFSACLDIDKSSLLVMEKIILLIMEFKILSGCYLYHLSDILPKFYQSFRDDNIDQRI